MCHNVSDGLWIDAGLFVSARVVRFADVDGVIVAFDGPGVLLTGGLARA